MTVCDDSDCGIILRFNINNNNDHGKHAGYEWDYNGIITIIGLYWIMINIDGWWISVSKSHRSLDWPWVFGEFEYWYG